MLFAGDDQFILGRTTNARQEALDGLRQTVEGLVDVSKTSNLVTLLV